MNAIEAAEYISANEQRVRELKVRLGLTSRPVNIWKPSFPAMKQVVEKPKEAGQPKVIRIEIDQDQHVKDWRAYLVSPAAFLIRKRASEFGFGYRDIVGPVRSKSLAKARHIIMYELHKTGRYSFPMLGRAFGGRDHTSCIHAVKRVERMLLSGEIDAKDLNI